jgi:hypothetical protein
MKDNKVWLVCGMTSEGSIGHENVILGCHLEESAAIHQFEMMETTGIEAAGIIPLTIGEWVSVGDAIENNEFICEIINMRAFSDNIPPYIKLDNWG